MAVATAAVCVGLASALACAEVLAPIAPTAPDAGAGEQAGEGEGEGEGEAGPRCGGEPELWPDAQTITCEPDVDACDRAADAPRAETDIQQVWSRVEGDAFVIIVELGADVPPVDSIDSLAFVVSFDLDRRVDRSKNGNGDDLCDQNLGYWLSTEHGPAYDAFMATVHADEVTLWNKDDFGVGLDTTIPLLCRDDLLVSGPFIRFAFPLDRVRGVDGAVVYTFTTCAGTFPDTFSDNPILTELDLPFGTCLWMESRGGAPDASIAFASYAECGPAFLVEGRCDE